MFFQLLFIHLFRTFLKYKPSQTPLPAHVSPRKHITHSATTISKLLRLYRRTYGLRQICNIVVYIAHTACTVHLLNLPDKTAQRDIQHGLHHLEEIAEGWLCARRTLSILHVVAKRWKISLPEAAKKVFMRSEAKFPSMRAQDYDFGVSSHTSPPSQPSPPLEHFIQPMPPSYSTPFPQPPLSQPLPQPTTQAPLQFFPPSTNFNMSPAETAPRHLSGDGLALPPQSPSDLARMSRQQNYIMPVSQQPQQQQPAWSSQQPTNTQRQATVGSPTALFGGVQGLMADQDWWLKDSQQLFSNWNSGVEGRNGSGGTGATYDFGSI